MLNVFLQTGAFVYYISEGLFYLSLIIYYFIQPQHSCTFSVSWLIFFFVFLLIFHVDILLARPRGLRGEFPGNSLGECEPLDAFNTRAAANAAS